MLAAYIDRIKQVYPELRIQDVEINEIGQNNSVFIINQSFVFRFPKYKAGIDRLLDETKILELVRGYSSQPIPEPIYQSFDELEVGKVFVGYPMIPGLPMWNEQLKQIGSDLEQKKLSLQLVNFLIQLHAVSEKEVKKLLPSQSIDLKEEYENTYKRIQMKLFCYMHTDAKAEVSALFEDFFAAIDEFRFTPTLIHGDFGASNILWDPAKMEITGIIDFGGSGLGDPAYDFAGILASYGHDFFARCIDLYPNGDKVANRAVFYQKTFALQEALHGVENNDNEALVNGLKKYR
ncbi:phosphotransferase [Virgibacillus dakarensis]|nr:phosphotransferase [Virgibacillus dakarensis]